MGPPGAKPGVGRGAPEREDFSESNYDEWSGYGGSILGGAAARTGDDAEDHEADSVFTRVEEFMDGRRKRKREEKLKEQEEKISKTAKVDYQAQFQDLKRQLAGISRVEWESLPDSQDLVKKTKK